MVGEVWLNNSFPFFCLPRGQIAAFLILLYLSTGTLYSIEVYIEIQRCHDLLEWTYKDISHYASERIDTPSRNREKG